MSTSTKSTEQSNVTLEQLFIPLANFIQDKNRGVTVVSVMKKFSLTPEGARFVLTAFYKEYAELLELKSGYYVTCNWDSQLTNKPVKCSDGTELICKNGRCYDGGVFATEDELEMMEETEDIDEALIYCVHPKHLDDSELFGSSDFETPISLDRAPLSTLFPKTERNAFEVLEKKRKEKAKIEALFAAACKREKVPSPKGKGKEPVRPKEDFFKPSPNKKKRDQSPPKTTNKPKIARNLAMDDVFTTGEDEEDRDEPIDEPQKMSSKAASKTVYGTPEKMEIDDVEPGPSEPTKVKRMQTVTDTYMNDADDDEGAFLVTESNKKMVETNEIAPPPPKKKHTGSAPAPSKAGGKAKKGQSSLLNFFKKS